MSTLTEAAHESMKNSEAAVTYIVKSLFIRLVVAEYAIYLSCTVRR